MTLDPVSVTYIMKNSTVYEKPWQSRKLISSLIGCGMLAAEGHMHKRQRRVATPAFSIQNLRALVPLVFRKGDDLKNRWLEFAAEQPKEPLRLDVCHWVSRATFDVIGVAGMFVRCQCLMRAVLSGRQASTTTSMPSRMRPMNCSMHTKICLKS
jgi:cytochrome P450